MRTLVLLFSTLSVLAGPAHAQTQERGTPIKLTAAQIASIKQSALSDLKDPESARFGTIGAVRLKSLDPKKDGLVVCGHVNAKNSFGGYTGMKAFMGSVDAKGGHVVVSGSDSDVVSAVCHGFGVPGF